MITLSGTHTCRKCSKEYTWQFVVFDSNAVTSGFQWNDVRKNVRKASLIPATGLYTVEVSCPYCGALNGRKQSQNRKHRAKDNENPEAQREPETL